MKEGRASGGGAAQPEGEHAQAQQDGGSPQTDDEVAQFTG
jgi:hypothetical protein